MSIQTAQLPTAQRTNQIERTSNPDARAMSRREFLAYAWGGAIALLGAEVGVASYLFLYPRFRAGEFGGDFPLGPLAAMPDVDAPPQQNAAGKFWLINTEAGPKALYTVCPHLGCLYSWRAEDNRFQCPCHNSQFSRQGEWLDGPAPRGLDQFAVTVVEGEVVVNTSSRTLGSPKNL